MQEKALNVTYFFIQGFSSRTELHVPISFVFLFIYIIIIGANLTIINIILTSPHLLTPMYIFLINLSSMDIMSTSAILPKLIAVLFTKQNFISVSGCITQFYFFFSMACAEMILLAAMAYDRYVAICHPLHYVILMSIRHCLGFSVTSWATGFLDLTGHAVLISRLSFCTSHLINHFFCDVTSLLKISCSDTSGVGMLNYVEGTIMGILTFLLTLVSYIFIISTILKIKSSEGRQKAFSTCSAHLTCVTIYYLTLICLYMRPTSSYSPRQDKFVSLLYVVLVPLLNPIIYSLKNEDVKKALRYKIKHFNSLGSI